MLLPISLTEEGIVIDVKYEHLANAYWPTYVTDCDISTCFNNVHEKNE